ncbi:hypothetical protein DPMN_180259 [Dreissena polymorpha]|uniref:Uncharacterized protein n=1 Tax=Dreissena polymorpha TaxID=45954 RepID=A0A9D4IP84_DREPO|nr:hypothetical protein DPMN_180259 [Dreissena polymorpha]
MAEILLKTAKTPTKPKSIGKFYTKSNAGKCDVQKEEKVSVELPGGSTDRSTEASTPTEFKRFRLT